MLTDLFTLGRDPNWKPPVQHVPMNRVSPGAHVSKMVGKMFSGMSVGVSTLIVGSMLSGTLNYEGQEIIQKVESMNMTGAYLVTGTGGTMMYGSGILIRIVNRP